MSLQHEIMILTEAAKIVEQDYRVWKASRGKKCAEDERGPLARELINKVVLRQRQLRLETE